MPITLPAQPGDPIIHRGITVVPLFPRCDPGADYTTLETAIQRGFRVEESGDEGSVPELVVTNPLADRVLLYDGEELIGAKQNRILNLTVLVAAASITPIPVSCVEAGRWHRRSATFAPSAHTAGPELRLRKARALGVDATARGVAQTEVWEAVAAQSLRHGVRSPTGAHADIFTHREPVLEELRAAFPAHPGQCGIALILPDNHVCLDYLSRPDAYADHHAKLLDGYLLDALDQLDRAAAKPTHLNRLLHRLTLVTPLRQPSAGMGIDIRAEARSVTATGLELDGELLQLSAYA
jgi:hypothetical protein